VTGRNVDSPGVEPAPEYMLREARALGAQRRLAADALRASAARLASRRALQPRLEYPASLPVAAHREAILSALREHQVIVVSGETGSGKTTQLPKLCLEAGLGRRGLIGHTQPRRLAARSVAARIAEETALPFGEGVGFQVRFTDLTAPTTLVKVMTDGILLNELQHDPLLLEYDTIIVDEAHERSLNIDFLLGYLHTLLPRRPELKLVITSATIDHQRFSQHFADAPVIEVSGRGYPVEVRYTSPDMDADNSRSIARCVADAVEALQRERLPEGAGDMLVFLPGEREIRDTERALDRRGLTSAQRGWEVLTLYGRLSDARQNDVFRPGRLRRIVLATNVAETSLTVPRIGAVIDSGLARVSRYSHRSRLQRLQLEGVSRASANQRAGRCGRIGPGICVRLFDEEDFASRPEYTDPEILRTNLASVVLQMAALAIGDIESFPFLDAPDPRQIDDAYRLLVELGAMTAARGITRLGRRLARLPLDPRLGRMLLAADGQPGMPAVLAVVAGLSIQDPRQRPMEEAAAADRAHAEFADARSDFVALHNLWCRAAEARANLKRRAFDAWCAERFLSGRRMREWTEVERQLARALGHGARHAAAPVASERERDALHRALLTGLLSHVGQREGKSRYTGAQAGEFLLHPSSGLRGKPPKWIMALEIVQTTRRFARIAAAVRSDWIVAAAAHLVQRSYDRPTWNARRGRVEARETVALHGLILQADRRIDFGQIDRAAARQVFIREALVHDRLRLDAPFRRHNEAVKDEIAGLAGRARRPFQVSESVLAQLFDDRLPGRVFDARSLKRWLKSTRGANERLSFSREVLLAEAPAVDEGSVPAVAEVAGNRVELAYRFAPGSADDGVTLKVPASLVPALNEPDVDASVPAFLEQRIVIRLRALPKAVRVRFHPLAATAADMRNRLADAGERGTLDDRLRRLLVRDYDLDVGPEAWLDLDEPAYLVPRIAVLDGGGPGDEPSRDVKALKQARRTDDKVTPTARPDEPEPSRSWTFGALPATVTGVESGVTLTRYPGLSVEGNGVVRRDYLDEREAMAAHDAAVLALLRYAQPQQVKALRKRVVQDRALQLAWSRMRDPGGGVLVDDVVEAAFRAAFDADFCAIRDEEAFTALRERGRTCLIASGEALVAALLEILEHHRESVERVDAAPEHLFEVVEDERTHLGRLVYPGFLRDTPPDRVADVSRYVAAVAIRLERVASNPARDRDYMAAVHSLEARRRGLVDAGLSAAQQAAIASFRWQLEELRVSLFAQQLGTREKVSVKRLEKRWDEILRL
jgi:ATP-dependent helicase HrpA